ncbi:TPA: hypothetical protein RPV57_001595 [Campylobacter fetus]|uniref:hypothetical protein n=2 Tax=Campylobacter fetus TaxID=196 RepID=UPI0005091E72|nr:hypothetical protein CFF04554_0661 [Campylobacter fetus subsp. fetus 04/554]EAJ9257420.1 hypothetical protein [Campylobacter fetus]WKW17949.1 hypothetical protein IXZ25_03475 [Campylobacter fetus subsp. fetus]EGK8172931.1 hypothetical protein [Campylobacter fetus]HDX6332415.1 hypothetical protein [Campylobacter fetus]
MNPIEYLEPMTTIVVLALTALNWLINQKIKILENRIDRLEDFEKNSAESFRLLREIKGKIDILLKNVQ